MIHADRSMRAGGIRGVFVTSRAQRCAFVLNVDPRTDHFIRGRFEMKRIAAEQERG